MLGPLGPGGLASTSVVKQAKQSEMIPTILRFEPALLVRLEIVASACVIIIPRVVLLIWLCLASKGFIAAIFPYMGAMRKSPYQVSLCLLSKSREVSGFGYASTSTVTEIGQRRVRSQPRYLDRRRDRGLSGVA